VLILSRLIHGTGWAAINTAGPSIALSNAPTDRKGAAIGYFNMFRAVTILLGPALGLWVAEVYGLPAVFVPLLRDPDRPQLQAAPADGGLIESRVLIPASIQVLLYCSAPLIFVFMPLVAADRSIEGLPWFYVAAGLTSIAVQPLARLSDTRGRGPSIAAGLTLSAVGLLVLASASELGLLVMGGVLWSGGLALVEPATTALAVESVPLSRRGAALATYGAAFQVGNGAGGVLWGFVIASLGFEWAFLGAVFLAVGGAAVLAMHWRWIMNPRTRSQVDDSVT
jgi:MFS family permease